jgi:hypothetical protein
MVGGAQYRHRASPELGGGGGRVHGGGAGGRQRSHSSGGGGGVVLGHQHSGSGARSFLGARGAGMGAKAGVQGLPLPAGTLDPLGDEALLGHLMQLRRELNASRSESIELSQQHTEAMKQCAYLQAKLDARGQPVPPTPAPATTAALPRVDFASQTEPQLEPEPEVELEPEPEPAQLWSFRTETSAQTQEAWPDTGRAAEQIAALQTQLATAREVAAAAAAAAARAAEAAAPPGEVESLRSLVAELRARCAEVEAAAAQAAERDLRIISRLEGEKSRALVLAREFEAECEDLRRQAEVLRQQNLLKSLESIKIGVVSPKVTIKLSNHSGAETLDAVAAMPREQLQEVLTAEVLPRFVRILTESNCGEAGMDMVDPVSASRPPAESPWLQNHITQLRSAIVDNLGQVFA